LALDWSNTLYIADSFNHRVQKYLRDASFGETVAGQKTGLSGTNSSFLNTPRYLAMETNGDIYVSDTNNHRVQFRDARSPELPRSLLVLRFFSWLKIS